MTSASTLRIRHLTRGLEAAGGAMVGDLDPFVAPTPSHQVVGTSVRSRAVLQGRVLDMCGTYWGGSPVVEVTLSDETGTVCLAFLGRGRIAGIEPGRALTAAGTVGSRHGRALLVNPLYWLHSPGPEVADA